MPNEERTDVTPTKNTRSFPRPVVAAKPASALSSAVSTISTITLNENDNKISDETDDLEKVYPNLIVFPMTCYDYFYLYLNQ